MTPRERILAALNHTTPDTVPIDCSGHRSSGISAIAYARLRQALGLPKRPIRVYDIIQQLAVLDDDLLERFGIDTIELGRAFARENHHWTEWMLPDGTPCLVPAWMPPEREPHRWVIRSASGTVLAQMPDGALYFEQASWPFIEHPPDHHHLSEAFAESMWTGIAAPPGPITDGPEGRELLGKGARQLREQSDRAILGLFGGNLLECGQFLYRNDHFLELMAADPTATHDFLDHLVEMHLANLERFLTTVGPFIDVIVFGDDLGMQTGPQMSPAMYRTYFKPRHALLWNRAKSLANVKVMLHCCGGVRELLPDLIEAGLDAINPVQISCAGMDARSLKKEFGREITFWGGGCDTQFELSRGTPDSIRDHVRRQVDILSPDGGFVFQQVHNIMADVPPENIIAMFDAVRS